MPRPVARLEVERMSIPALWTFVRWNFRDCSIGSTLDYKDAKLLFENVEAALQELDLRGQQLEIPWEQSQTDNS